MVVRTFPPSLAEKPPATYPQFAAMMRRAALRPPKFQVVDEPPGNLMTTANHASAHLQFTVSLTCKPLPGSPANWGFFLLFRRKN
jgi:hypothetical protein